MWQSIKTVSHDVRKSHEILEDSIKGCQRQYQESLERILSEIKKMHDTTNRSISKLSEQIDSLDGKVRELDREVNKMKSKSQEDLSAVQGALKDCSDEISGTNKKLEEFAEDVRQNLSMVDEGTRLVIANMLLGEMGEE